MAQLFHLSNKIWLLSLFISCIPWYYSHGAQLDCQSSCGKIHNISSPFRFQGDPEGCGQLDYQLICTQNQTIVVLNSKKYFVEDINFVNQTIRILDPGVLGNNCSYMPSYFPEPADYNVWPYSVDPYYYGYGGVVFVNCLSAVNDSSYIDMAPCRHNNSPTNEGYKYALVGRYSVEDLRHGCHVVNGIPIDYTGDSEGQILTYQALEDILRSGIVLEWTASPCSSLFHSGHCFVLFLLNIARGIFPTLIKILGYLLLARTIIGVLLYSAFLIYKLREKFPVLDDKLENIITEIHRLRQRYLALDDKLENFITENKSHLPKRYSYKEILKITDRLIEKIGQGGFGSVYKGKLPNGNLVAVKMLGKLKVNNSNDFINEVATIGRTHHVNVVHLIGFCAEKSKRALIYEFMPNGSLDKYLSSRCSNDDELKWRKLHEIALGIARGIEYLHRGCSMKILHFDIKPHNILLDEYFTPKVSDFGLAKFYPIENSMVSITAIRGTIGYIAPELFYRKIGNVSYKSDVYSYGMLLMEIVGRKRNIDQRAENSSQIYFPSWMYDQLDMGRELGHIFNDIIGDDEKDMLKKLALVALWCIQLSPSDRPSMSKVVEMIEGSLNELEMPRRPFMSYAEWSEEDHRQVQGDQSNPGDSLITIVSGR